MYNPSENKSESEKPPFTLYDCLMEHVTEKCFLVMTRDRKKIWIPKSQVDPKIGTDMAEKGDVGFMTIPHWLADAKGLLDTPSQVSDAPKEDEVPF